MKAALLASLLMAVASEQAPQPVSRQASAGGATVTVSTPNASVRAGEPLAVEFRIERPATASPCSSTAKCQCSRSTSACSWIVGGGGRGAPARRARV